MDALPTYPVFKDLSIDDKKTIEQHVASLEPYSDYNFLSLYTWNTDESIKYTFLNDNLIVRFKEYNQKNYFYSIHGTNNVGSTIKNLMTELDIKELKLVPEATVERIKQEDGLIIQEQRDESDYILSASLLKDMPSSKLRGKRNLVNRFERYNEGNYRVEHIEKTDNKHYDSIMGVFEKWRTSQERSKEETSDEKIAIERFLNNWSEFKSVFITCVYINDSMEAFSINESVSKKWGVLHYEKANIDFTGIFSFLKRESADKFYEKGIEYINYEQDLGIPGLRRAKELHKPVKMLKKYKVKLQ